MVGGRFVAVGEGEQGQQPAVRPKDETVESAENAAQPAENAASWPDPAAPGLVACTVATSADLPWVRVLRQSFRTEHPDGRLVTLIVDVEPAERWDDMITPATIGVDDLELSRLATAYSGDQLCALLLPRLLRTLLADGRPVLALDRRVLVLGSLAELVAHAVSNAPLALVPRALAALPRDGLRPTPDELHAAGMFTPDLLAVAPGAEPFLVSWEQRLREAPEAVGTRLDTAATMLDYQLIRDEGLGLSVWSAAERELWCPEDGVLSSGEQPVRTVHFDGFDPRRPWLLSAQIADRPRTLLSEHPLLAELCASYHTELVRSGYSDANEDDHFAALPDGTVLPSALRMEYRELVLAGDQLADEPIPPAAVGPAADLAGFLAWAGSAADAEQRAAGLSRWAAALWRSDPELQAQFPDPHRADAEDYRRWCADFGVATGRLPAESVLNEPHAVPLRLLDQLGVTVSGEGPVAESLHLAVRASGLPSAADALYPVVLHAGDADSTPIDRYLVAVRTTAEAASLAADDWAERWVASEASHRLLSRDDGPETHALRLPVSERAQVTPEDRAAMREQLGISGDFTFVSIVDQGQERSDNALGSVAAFGKAFPDRDDVRLVFLVRNARRYPEAAERLRLATASDRRIQLIEDVADTDPRHLLAAAHCVLSLHRANPATAGDAIALALLDATARGIPVLASEHGAVAEHFGDRAGLLVRCLQPGEPDLASAADLMRNLADDPDGAARLGMVGRQYVRQEWSPSACAPQLRALVEQAYRSWRARRSSEHLDGELEDPLGPLLAAKHALHRRPDVDVSSRIPMAPALRKAVLRVLNHYDAHLRDVLRTMLDGMERTASELARRQDRLGGIDGPGVAEVRAELDRVAEQLGKLGGDQAGSEDGLLRVRADLASQGRQLRALEEAAPAGGDGQRQQIDAVADRLDRLTVALDRTLDRIDVLESRTADDLRERDVRMEAGLRAASQSIRVSDALSRVMLREHQRNAPAEPDGDPTSLVLCDAGLLRLPAEDVMMLPWLSTHGVWEPELSAFIDSLLEPDGIFVDIGAHVGYHSIRVLSRLGTSGAVVAVEPGARERELLRHNVSINVSEAVAEHLLVIPAAAWDAPGELLAAPAFAGGLDVRPLAGDGQRAAGEQQGRELFTPQHDESDLRVPAVRLDQTIESDARLHDLRVSVVKVDTPGRGHRALGGLVRLLRRDRPHVVCSFSPSATAELGDDPAAVLREFNTWGYDIVPFGEDAAITPDRVLAAVTSAGAGSTATLWLRPKGRRE